MRMQALPSGASTDSRFDQMIASSPHGMLLTDEQGLITCWNRALEHITGFPDSQVVGEAIWTVQDRLLVETDESPQLRVVQIQFTQTLLAHGTADGVGQALQFWIRHAGGELRLLDASLFALKTAHGFQIVG